MKIDFYTQIHKALRRLIFNMSIKVANSDYSNLASCRRNHDEMLKLFALLTVHAEHEEKFFHPLIATKLNKSKQLDTEHQYQEKLLIDLERLSHSIILLPEASSRVEQGFILYRQFNQFIIDYLQHMAFEESLMPVLQEVCSEQELLQTLQALLSSFSQQDFFASVVYMLPALNPKERLDMISALLAKADKNAAVELIQLAREAISNDEWLMLKTQLFPATA